MPVSPAQAFAGTLPIALDTIFQRWHGPLPPVKRIVGQDGPWGTVGQTRTVVTADGGRMREELITVEAPNSFSYQLSEIKGPSAALVARILGEWRFAPATGGTRVTWQWEITPRKLAGPAMPAFDRLWHGYARKSLAGLAQKLTGAA